MEPLVIRLFGGFEATLGNARLMLQGQKEQAVLAVLAASRGGEQSRDRLAGLLWSDRGNALARDSLKHAIAHIRQSLSALGHRVIEADRTAVRLVPEGLVVDATRFEACAAAATTEGDLAALDLFRGPFLDGLHIADAAFQDWLLVDRARYQGLAEVAAHRQLARAVAGGAPHEVVAAHEMRLARWKPRHG